MSSTTIETTGTTTEQDLGTLKRILDEGYGPGAWHGPDLKAALADVPATLAFERPAAGRHSIAEIALHHAFCLRSVRGKVSGETPQPFVLPGEDWFEVDGKGGPSWTEIQAVVESEQSRLAAAMAGARSPLTPGERFDLALGLTCHAVYHAGQIQLIKRLCTT